MDIDPRNLAVTIKNDVRALSLSLSLSVSHTRARARSHTVCVHVRVCVQVRIDLTNVSAKFKSFNWTYNKTTFPKAKDAGVAEVLYLFTLSLPPSAALISLLIQVNIEGLEAHVTFEMVTNDQAVMTIDHMKARIELGHLAVSVAEAGGSAAKKWMCLPRTVDICLDTYIFYVQFLLRVLHV